MTHTKYSFGRDVLGPIFAEFSLRLWIYLANLAQPDDTALLFCARGGLRLQLLYDGFLAASGLESPVPTAELMVSRLVAVRPALLAGAESAYQQLDYECADASVVDVAMALGGVDVLDVGNAEIWQEPYSRAAMTQLLGSDAGQPVRDAMLLQARRFRTHLADRSGGRPHVVLCDTGLFGSTLQLLMDGLPDLSWSATMVGRANFKRLPTPHFSRTVGLSVESSQYCPWRPRTAMLRYWHLIESVLEPNLPSVTRFSEQDGVPRSNLEVDNWQARVLPEAGSIFAGILDCVSALPRSAAVQIMTDVSDAWAGLRRAVVWPSAHDSFILDPGERSVDFGHEMTVRVVGPWRGIVPTLQERSLWREGEIARWAPSLRAPLLLGLETAYGLRWVNTNMQWLLCRNGRVAQPSPQAFCSPDATAIFRWLDER